MRCKIRLQKNAAKKAAVAAYIMIYTVGGVEVTWLWSLFTKGYQAGVAKSWSRLPGWGNTCVEKYDQNMCVRRQAAKGAKGLPGGFGGIGHQGKTLHDSSR